jgi:hypothetical protein
MKLTIDEDGPWLDLKTEDGSQASINLRRYAEEKTTPLSSAGARNSLDDRCIRAFKSYVRRNKIRSPTGQDAAQFFTDAAVRREFPCEMGYPEVWKLLESVGAFVR